MKNLDTPMYKVRLRGGFSDRNNINSENKEMQYTSLDERTRNMLINLTSLLLHEVDFQRTQEFYLAIIFNVFAWEWDFSKRCDEEELNQIIFQVIRENSYDEVFSMLEFLIQQFVKMFPYNDEDFASDYNAVFEKEYVGYRFLNQKIVPITDENEMESIEQALKSPYSVVNVHMSKAVTFLADRENPDYENSIKESISAVEAICEILTGVKGKEATLGNMLKKIEESGVVIHGALKSAFNILYGYTSDANGIRHAGDIGGPSSTFEEAKFMLVSCSAFINYLIGVSAQ